MKAHPLSRTFLPAGTESRNSGYVCDPGQPWSVDTEITLEHKRSGQEVMLSFLISFYAPLLSCSSVSSKVKAHCDSDFTCDSYSHFASSMLVHCVCEWMQGVEGKGATGSKACSLG